MDKGSVYDESPASLDYCLMAQTCMKGKQDSVECKHIMHHLNSESLSSIVTYNENISHATELHGCTWIDSKIRISLPLHN
jgi:hypothetical protein